MTWYKQTAVWAVIISVIALILSQLPPIGAWIPRNDVKAEINKRIGLPSMIGIPGYLIIIDLTNTGNRSLTISNLKLEVVYPNSTATHIEAQSYLKILSGQPEPQSFPITSIKLNAGEGWAEMVLFHPMPSPNEEEEINRIKLQISQSIFSKIRALPRSQYNPNLSAEADPKFVAEAINFFNRRFDLEKGTYKASLICDVNGRKVTLKEFEFTLYDYHIKTFKSQPEDYKYGLEVIPNKQVWALISKGG